MTTDDYLETQLEENPVILEKMLREIERDIIEKSEEYV